MCHATAHTHANVSNAYVHLPHSERAMQSAPSTLTRRLSFPFPLSTEPCVERKLLDDENPLLLQQEWLMDVGYGEDDQLQQQGVCV